MKNTKTENILYITFSLIYVSVCMHLPVGLYSTAYGDDALYWTQANSIVAGNWLGPYNATTMAKGPGYSIFLALNYLLGIPITLTLCLLNLLAYYVIVRLIKYAGVNATFSLLIFVLLLFIPNAFPIRIIRDNIYPALSLLVMACFSCIAINENYRVKLSNTLVLGFLISLFYMTREEGVWIFPALFLASILFIYNRKKFKTASIGLIFTCIKILLASLFFYSIVGAINYKIYGAFEVVDFKGDSFKNVLARIYSVRVGDEVSYLPAKYEKRLAIYEVSPSFAKLKEYLELDGKNAYKELACSLYPEYYSHACGDYPAGWWIWVFREAVQAQGQYENPRKAKEFYDSVTREITQACESGRLRCASIYYGLLPPLNEKQIKSIPDRIYKTLLFIITDVGVVKGSPSTGSIYELALANDILRYPYSLYPSSYDQLNTHDKWLKLKENLFKLYYWFAIFFAIFGFISLLVDVFESFKFRRLTTVTQLSFLFWTAFISRVLLIVFVDITGFPAINAQYLGVAFPLFYVASLLSIYSLLLRFQPKILIK